MYHVKLSGFCALTFICMMFCSVDFQVCGGRLILSRRIMMTLQLGGRDCGCRRGSGCGRGCGGGCGRWVTPFLYFLLGVISTVM